MGYDALDDATAATKTPTAAKMRSNKPFLVATFLVAWICITYFLWARQATIDLLDDDYKMVYRRLNQLEADVQREDQNNRLLVQRLLVVVQNIDKVCMAFYICYTLTYDM